MKILAIESSSLVASAAILEDDVLIAEYTTNHKITHSQTLLPMINEIISMTNTDKKSIDAIAVSGGPGSYTGLRIGSATAKGIGMALDIPLIHVPTIDAMAYNAYGYNGIIVPIMDAKRSQVYTGIFRFDDNGFNTILKNSAISIDELLIKVLDMAADDKVLFIGDGIPAYKNIIEDRLDGRVKYEFAPANMNRQRAASVAVLGACYMEQGKYEDASEHLPEYLRLSQAERELQERMSKQ